jgi:hypothetical protein
VPHASDENLGFAERKKDLPTSADQATKAASPQYQARRLALRVVRLSCYQIGAGLTAYVAGLTAPGPHGPLKPVIVAPSRLPTVDALLMLAPMLPWKSHVALGVTTRTLTARIVNRTVFVARSNVTFAPTHGRFKGVTVVPASLHLKTAEVTETLVVSPALYVPFGMFSLMVWLQVI